MTQPHRKPFYKDAESSLRPVPFSKPLILCIEDDPIYLTLRKAVLEKDGYNVIGVTSPTDALQILREAPVCCIIADHMLRGMSGLQMAAAMKKLKPDVPVMLFSGSLPENLHN